jgi:DNA repair ATPase RecN
MAGAQARHRHLIRFEFNYMTQKGATMTTEFDQIEHANRRVDRLAEITEKHEVTHREIFDRLVAVELKVDNIDGNTKDMVAAFTAAQGAFTVLEWLAKAVKPLLWIGAAATTLALAWQNIRAR